MTRLLVELPCGCLVGDEGMMLCCYYAEDETPIHKKCMQLYFEEHKTVDEIWNIIGHGDNLDDYLELNPNDYVF